MTKKGDIGDVAFYVLEALDYVQRSLPSVAFYPHPPQRYENILKNRCSIFRFYYSIFRFLSSALQTVIAKSLPFATLMGQAKRGR